MHWLRTSVLLSCGLLLPLAGAQQRWQTMQMPTTAEVRQTWVAPPPEYGPEPYYGLNGPVDEAVIRRDLDAMKGLGFQAVTVQFGYGSAYRYLSPEYFQFFRTFVEEAKKRGMRVWIVDDAGYPSGFAGGKFSELKPELRMQALVAAKTVSAAAGETVSFAVTPDTMAVTAVNQEDGSEVQVPFAGGAVRWTAPAGSWSVVAMEHRFSTSPTRSDTNPKRVKDGSQSLEDYLDPAATRQFLEFTHEQYRKYVGEEFGKTILGFRGDEPDYSIRGLPWTPKFFSRFEQIKGYDVRSYVATFGLPKMTETERRAKADYYDVFATMFRDGFFKVQGDWCAANHLEYQVHLNHEEMEMQLTRSEGEFFRAMREVQVPGIDSIWHQIWTDTVSDFPRLASSVSHVYGKPRAFTESFAAYRPEPDIAMARYVLNEQFVRGINLVETMYYPASATPGRGRSPYMNDPGFPDLLAYTRRMSYLLAMGRPAAQVALYLPSSSLWMGDAGADKAFVTTERLLSEHQVDFDIVGEDALAADLTMKPGGLCTASGNCFGAVIIPGASVLSEEALRRLHAFARGGGRVLFLGKAPGLIYGKNMVDARSAGAADFAGFTVEPWTDLPETPTPPAQPPAEAPGPLEAPGEVVAAVLQTAGRQGVTLDGEDTALRVMKRRLKDADVYVVFNEGARESAHAVTLRSEGRTVERWDPQTGKVVTIPATYRDGAAMVAMKLQPYEVEVVVVR